MSSPSKWLFAVGFASQFLAWQLLADDTPSSYTPVERQVEGWTVAIDPQLLDAEHQKLGADALAALANHLQRIKYILPEQRVTELQRLQIWIELENPKLAHMQYHPDADWLTAH